MTPYEIHIPSDDGEPRVERVHGDNWLDALRRGLKAAGRPAPTRNLGFNLLEDGTVIIQDADTGDLFRVVPIAHLLPEPMPGTPLPRRVSTAPPPAVDGFDDPFDDSLFEEHDELPSAIRPMALRNTAQAARAPRDTRPVPPRGRPESGPPLASSADTLDFEIGGSLESQEMVALTPPPRSGEGPGVQHPLLVELERLDELGTDVFGACGFALDSARRHIECGAGSILLIDARDRCLYFAVVRGPKSEGLRSQRVPLEVGLAGACIRTRRSLNVTDPARDPRFARSIADTVGHVPSSILAAPIVHRRRAFGVIELLDRSRRKTFSDADEALLRRAARRLGAYLSQLVPG